jgi:acetoin utilization protein AcuC
MTAPRHRLVDALSLPPYSLGAGHPFAADRQRPLFDLLRRQRLFADDELLRPAPASLAELALGHDPAYVAAIRALSDAPDDPRLLRDARRYGMATADNPVGAGQHDGAAAIVGATLACVRAVVSGEADRAFDPAGGLHHAMPAAASGFCVYNDLVVGIREARRLGMARVAYVDFDVHHGDGVEFAFRTDPSVLTISFHETPRVRWPFTGEVTECGEGPGRGSAVNMPFASHTGDASWQECVAAVLDAFLTRFRPELLVTQHGCDPHHTDPLAELDLTTASFRFAAELSRDLAVRHCGGRWVATGGGGYRPYSVIPRAWAMVWCAMSGRPLPELVDPAWRAAWQPRAPEPLPERFVDAPLYDPRHAASARENARTLARLLALHGLDAADGGSADRR